MKPSNQTHERRLAALDAARGLAVAGMFIQHFALNQYNSFVSGNTMILFILCSGISYTLSFERARRAGDNGHFPVKMLARIKKYTLKSLLLQFSFSWYPPYFSHNPAANSNPSMQ